MRRCGLIATCCVCLSLAIENGHGAGPGMRVRRNDVRLDFDGRGRHDLELRRYSVTIHNLASGQPLSPPVAATHSRRTRVFQVGGFASPGLEAIAEDGNQGPMFERLSMSPFVTEAIDVGRPLARNGAPVDEVTDGATFSVRAHPSDVLSLAAMLICTNDGFTGLDSARLPRFGSRVFFGRSYDAGTEENTEVSEDIVDACSALGSVELPGDPDGNEDEAVDTRPHQPIAHHPNIQGTGELTVEEHGWTDPVIKVTVTAIDEDGHFFAARLSGAGEVPPVASSARGWALVRLDPDEQSLTFTLIVQGLSDVTQSHIHVGLPSANGPVVAFLFSTDEPLETADGFLARGTVAEEDLIGPLEGDFAGLVEAIRTGGAYVNVHTVAHPAGEIRGQLGALGR